jgi:predicted TIM-barrel fold metal-dependent hydrolase
MDYRVIDAGTHATPPPEMWVERFPAELRDRAPRKEVRHDARGAYEVLVLEGEDVRPLASSMGVPRDQIVEPMARAFDEGLAGKSDPRARIADMDRYGCDAQLIVRQDYPLLQPKDLQTWWGIVRATNDWLSEFCSYAPERLLGTGQLPTWDMDLTLQEARTIKRLGLRAVQLPGVPGHIGNWSTPADHHYLDPWWEPLWTELEALDLVVVAHVDSWGATPGLAGYLGFPGQAAVNLAMNKGIAAEMVTSLIFSKTFDRHPSLRVVLNETGIGWAAHLVPWMDILMEKQPGTYTPLGLTRMPSQYWREHFIASTLWDSCGVKNRDILGLETLAWCSDYPENYGTYLYAQEQQDRDLAGCTEDERCAILAGNARRVFRL